MFCPKCKYTTFDFYRNCPKCNFDWNSIRKELGIDWMMEPDVIKATEIPEEDMEMKANIPLPKEEIEMETTGDISRQEKEEEIEFKLGPSLMLDNEEKESHKEEPELIRPEIDEIEITQESEIDVIPLGKEEKHESEVWDIEFEDLEKDKKIESNTPDSEKDTESLIPEIDLEILLDEEEKQSKN